MSKQEFLRYMIDFTIHIGWEDCNGKEQLRSLFTSWCLIYRVDADTRECNEALSLIYFTADMKGLIEYEEYVKYMIEFIV